MSDLLPIAFKIVLSIFIVLGVVISTFILINPRPPSQ